MNFSRFLDIQSWWEVPSVAYFCSLFRTAFNLLDFDIEELEEALLTDGTEESASSLLTELIVRLLNGCLGNNDISSFNYQMYLRRLFRQKCQETGRYNPFNTDIDFQFLPLRTKIEILYALCDFRLDADDVLDLFKTLEAESLRVEPLGWDNNDSTYWYFYGTRLYREDIIRKPQAKNKKKRSREGRKRGWFYGDDWLDDEESERVWQVVCFSEEDWTHLTEKFSTATSKVERELHRSLSENFLPEIPRLFREKERLQRKRLLESAPRRTSSRVLRKKKQKLDKRKRSVDEDKVDRGNKRSSGHARDTRARRRNLLRSKSISSDSSDEGSESEEEMPQKVTKKGKASEKRSSKKSVAQKRAHPPEPPVRTGRKTNNSLASATGQIVIPDNVEPVNSTRKKLKTSQIFSQTDEDVQIDMYKVLEQLSAHDEAWPFMDPVEEEYAPNYYSVIRRPMDLRKMEERLDSGYYTDFNMFKADFKLIVNNCRLYNGQDNEYTVMVDNLQAAFDRLTEKYIHSVSSSDEEIAVEYQLPTPARKHKLKRNESPIPKKRKKRKSRSDAGEPKSSCSDQVEQENEDEEMPEAQEENQPTESHKSKQDKGKKKRKGHHKHGKHSRNHKRSSHRSEHESRSRHSKKLKHAKNKDREGKKSKKKKSKYQEPEEPIQEMKRSDSRESLESSNRSRSASPLPSIHTPTPTSSPTPSPTDLGRRSRRDQHARESDQLTDPDFYKDKYDKIKERRRHAAKDAWESLFDYKQKAVDKQKQNLRIPEKDKNQKLRETIEKLKAKNAKYKHSFMFNSLFTRRHSADKNLDSYTKDSKDDEPDNSNDDEEEVKEKQTPKKRGRKTTARNQSATVALEQAVKDISKWLDDAPKARTSSSPPHSPAQTISTEDPDTSRHDDESSQGDKPVQIKKEITRKRRSSREPKPIRRREIQRTIDRLQPGKSKGNLLTNMSNKGSEKVEDFVPTGPLNKTRDLAKTEETSPKLSLGSVLPAVEFTLGNDHNFTNDDDDDGIEIKRKRTTSSTSETKLSVFEEVKDDSQKEDKQPLPSKKDAEVETEPILPLKPNQEKATPNLSAWFKAFGTPKATTSTIMAKKKSDNTESDMKLSDKSNTYNKPNIVKNIVKVDSPNGAETLGQDGGESPLPHLSATPRQRRTSTGSSVSERSSFSQDLDSPRHQMSHNSPLLQSPASPRHDDFQKISYPIINGTVRAGFYQDTTSVKSSPEKNSSPREMPQSPYSPYSQHVYISNSAAGSSTPNYFIDHNKSPLPAYGQSTPSYYDASKSPTVCKPLRHQDDYTPFGSEAYQQNIYNRPYSPTTAPYPPMVTKNYAQSQVTADATPVITNSELNTSASNNFELKATNFPVKKRTYNEPEELTKKIVDLKEIPLPPKADYPKISQPAHLLSSVSATSVDDMALAIKEKSENAKINSLREKNTADYVQRHIIENRDNIYDTGDIITENKMHAVSNRSNVALKKDRVDMVNMGYLNPDIDRRNDNEIREVIDFAKPTALNLGINNHSTHKGLVKTSIGLSNMTPAHCHERQLGGEIINQNLAHAHHSQFDANNFSLCDIELANKKLYACNSTHSNAAIDYGNWKVTNQIRKCDIMPSDYSTTYNAHNEDKSKTEVNVTNTAAINYNKNLQQHQYNSYNAVPRASLQRLQEAHQTLPAEIRIPNPRSMLKHDHITIPAAHSDGDYITKNLEAHNKTQKTDKLSQNHSQVSSIPYKTSYSTHPSKSLETLRNMPPMLERYANEEIYLPSFATAGAPLYHDKSFSMFNKSLSSEVSPIGTSTNVYSQASPSANKDSNIYKTSPNVTSTQVETKAKIKRKRTAENKSSPTVASQAYHTPTCSTDMLNSVKPNMMPASAFGFGASPNMTLGGALYGDNGAFSIEDFRNSTSQLMAANYMAAAVAHQQRNTADAGAEKLVKPAHQNSAHTSGSFPFIGHGQVRAGYPFVGAETSSPLYQQYLQRHQEELLRQTGAQIMSLYSPAYPATIGVRPPPYDAINRHSWL